ncbi:dedicator of cytokinesis protein 3-like [Daphnia carinata]|uniref:dedicator of cytokinesis protein 3-like n=1 Tax=Daphnia carinata TaxID=120202 RepID=UPI002868705A|nr:dedicator of cytokinesis protein 3-like [Daphnia carinata]
MGWSSQTMLADGHHSSQMEWQRKEQLYMKSIAYFDRGKCWEKGIPLCKELADFYETRLYDYGKLSHVLRMQAAFYDHILTQLRPEPEYSRRLLRPRFSALLAQSAVHLPRLGVRADRRVHAEAPDRVPHCPHFDEEHATG